MVPRGTQRAGLEGGAPLWQGRFRVPQRHRQRHLVLGHVLIAVIGETPPAHLVNVKDEERDSLVDSSGETRSTMPMTSHKLVPLVAAILSLASCRGASSEAEFAIMPAWTNEMGGLQHYSLGSGMQLYVQKSALVTMDDIKKASPVVDQMDAPAVLLELEPAAAGRLARFSTGHVSEPLAVFIEGELVSAPIVLSAISSTFLVTGFANSQAAQNFAKQCNQAAARQGE